MSDRRKRLIALVEEEAARSIPGEVTALADEIRSRGRGVAAILFYGSGLWQGPSDDGVLDFYVLVDRYRSFDRRRVPALLAHLLPPNVYYLEFEINGKRVRCKYAVMRLDQFRRAAAGRSGTPQIWARFAQPCRFAYVRDRAARHSVAQALADAVTTFHRATLPLLCGRVIPEDIWRHGLARTYAAELRSEAPERAAAVYHAAPDSFARRTRLAAPLTGLAVATPDEASMVIRAGAWSRRRAQFVARLATPYGKLITLLRLMKAGLTFAGGVDYILWKIERHSGVRVEPSSFQRRHPLIGGWPLMWKIYRRGGFR